VTSKRASAAGAFPFRRFLRNALVWLPPVLLVWVVLTPYYNLFLVNAGENLLHLIERPDRTRLTLVEGQMALIGRTDLEGRGQAGSVGRFRVTDVHFPVLLLAVGILAVPGVPLRDRLEALGWSLLVLAFLHLVSVVFWVQFVYTTQLGAWSAERYGPVARNFWGLGKHLLDLVFKFAVPLALWAWFFLPHLAPATAGGDESAS
jgi:hypothetical protein